MTFKANASGRGTYVFLIFAGVTAVAVLLGFVFQRMTGGSESVKERLETAQRRLEKNNQLIRKARGIHQEYQSLLADYKQQNSQEEVMSSILSEIQAVSGRIKSPITDLKPSRVRTVDSFNHFSVSLALEGDLTNIMQFIYILQNPPYNFYVDELLLRREYSKSTDLRCQVVLKKILIP